MGSKRYGLSRRGFISGTGAAGGMAMHSAPLWDALPASRDPHLEVNVRAFGARGDGVSDDTAAVQAAFDAVDGGSGAVFFPPGVYSVSSTLPVPSNTRLYGAGYSSTILGMKDNQIILSIADCHRVLVESLRFTGTGRLGVAGRGAIWLAQGKTAGPRDCRVSNCWIEGVGTSGIVVGNASRCSVSSNVIDGTAEHGIYLSASSGCIVSNNTVRDAGRRGGVSTCVGIKIADTTESTVIANVVESPLTEGIVIEHGTARCTIMGNVVREAPQRAIRVNARTTGIQITGNILARAMTEAIRVFGGTGCNITGNTIDSANNTAIAIDGPTRSALITGNLIVTGPANGWTIRISGSGHLVHGNYLAACDYGIFIDAKAKNIRLLYNQIEATKRAYTGVQNDNIIIDVHDNLPRVR